MEKDHLKSLEEVLKHLDNAGLRVKMKKCKFMKPEVDYLGHKIDKTGLHPLPDNVQEIQDAPTYLSVHELKSYLGLLTCYKFYPSYRLPFPTLPITPEGFSVVMES